MNKTSEPNWFESVFSAVVKVAVFALVASLFLRPSIVGGLVIGLFSCIAVYLAYLLYISLSPVIKRLRGRDWRLRRSYHDRAQFITNRLMDDHANHGKDRDLLYNDVINCLIEQDKNKGE